MRRVLLGLLIGLTLLGVAGCGAAGAPVQALHSETPPAVQLTRHGYFISLWPACACGRTTVLDRFSLMNGRRIGTVVPVQVKQGEQLATPAVDRTSRIWLTFSSGPLCTSGVAGCGPKPGSCAGRVERLDPRTGAGTTVLSSSGSVQLSDALPSPDGRRVVLVEGGCVTGYFNQHLVVRDLRTARQWSIGADAAPCHELTTPSWSADGRRLVFGYGPSVLSRHAHPAPGTCQAPRFNRLVIVSAQHSSPTTSWHLIRAPRGCGYQAATFDRGGVAAVQSCVGSGRSPLSVGTGHAFLVQLDHRERVTRRLALKPGWEAGAISTEADGTVLVSQSQPANSGYPERDWVWQFDGHALHLVATYRARDAAQVIAIPAAAP